MGEPALMRVYQCPGCWSMSQLPESRDGYECECGERLTLIDLRDTGGVGMALGSLWHADRGRLLAAALDQKDGEQDV